MTEPSESARRPEEQLKEASGWTELIGRFYTYDIDCMVCPHCGGTTFEFMTHQKGSFTLRCCSCHRFVHGRGLPDWIPEHLQSTDRYVPLPLEGTNRIGEPPP